MEEVKKILSLSKKEMEKSLEHIKKSFYNIRTGKAHPNLLDTIKVEYYGVITALNKIANISIIDSTTLSIYPWERSLLSSIERAIINANIGFTPMNNGEAIIIHLPPMTEERRKELVKRAKEEAELGKVSIRNVRKETNHLLKKNKNISEDLLELSEEKVQKITNTYIHQIDELLAVKAKEIMTI
ncbi:MAG: ribosome recycling factor [Candidatus Walczuchella monophlebidarum]